MSRPFIFIDCETTGLDPADHEIIEIAAIRTDSSLRELERLSLFVLPTHPETAHEKAIELTGFDLDRWRSRGAVPLSEALDQLAPLLEGAIPAGHFVEFDLKFLTTAYHRLDRAFPSCSRRRLDTVELCWPMTIAGLIERRRLIDVASALGISHEQPHSAVCDVEATLEIARKLLARYVGSLNDLGADSRAHQASKKTHEMMHHIEGLKMLQ